MTEGVHKIASIHALFLSTLEKDLKDDNQKRFKDNKIVLNLQVKNVRLDSSLEIRLFMLSFNFGTNRNCSSMMKGVDVLWPLVSSLLNHRNRI